MARKARKNMPHTVRVDHPTGRSKNITYRNQREMLQYVGMSIVDNGYERDRRVAQNAATAILNGTVYVGGATYQIVVDGAT